MFKAGKIEKLGDSLSKSKKSAKVVKKAESNLSKVEIAFILGVLKNTTFKGDNVELLYNLVIKLQNQYTELEKNV